MRRRLRRCPVVCPKGPGDPGRPRSSTGSSSTSTGLRAGSGKVGFLAEYVYSFVATAWLTAEGVRDGDRFDVMQACNPPDIFWPLGLASGWLGGMRFVFDHHDLCPELYESRFPDGTPARPTGGFALLERRTVRTADRVISTNDSYRAIAIERGGKRPEDVTVVRTGPDPERLQAGDPDPSLRRGRPPPGGLHRRDGAPGRRRHGCAPPTSSSTSSVATDIGFTLIGCGDCFDELRGPARRARSGRPSSTSPAGFPTRPSPASSPPPTSASRPDPKNPLNDVSTMNKTMEYMAFGLPVVAFDLRETRVSAADAAVYAEPERGRRATPSLIVELLDDEPRATDDGRRSARAPESRTSWPGAPCSSYGTRSTCRRSSSRRWHRRSLPRRVGA